MEEETAHRLVELNRKFYQDFGAAFSATRQRIQPGVRSLLARLPDDGRWLDLGCGNGALARMWKESGRKSAYLGLDFSSELLAAAARELGSQHTGGAGGIAFRQVDLSTEGWGEGLPARGCRGALAFAVLHHLPSQPMRERLLRQVHDLLIPGGCFFLSVWQFQNSPRMMARRLPWALAGINPDDVDEGDTLLDWRYALPGQGEQIGLRYVHLFKGAELEALAAGCGFIVQGTFESDGQGGRLSLYQEWKAL